MNKSPETNNLMQMFNDFGPAPFSYWCLSASQILIGTAITGPLGVMMIVMGLFGALIGRLHKGLSFDEMKDKAEGPKLKFPWTQKTTHMIVCFGGMLICAELLSTELVKFESLAYASIVFCVLAGWLASLVPAPEKKSN